MKSFLFFHLFFIFFATAFSQTHNCNIRKNKIKIFEFIVANSDSVRKNSEAEQIVVSIAFNPSGTISNVSYIVGDTLRKAPDFENGIPVKVWDKLDKYIRNLFTFCPGSDFEFESGQLSDLAVRLDVRKEIALRAIEFIKSDTIDYENNIIIRENNKFVLKFAKLEMENLKIPYREIQSELDIYSSDIIELSKGCFFMFRVMKTSGPGFNGIRPVFYIEYKIFNAFAGIPILVYKNSGEIQSGKFHEGMKSGEIYTNGIINQKTKHFALEFDIAFE